MRSRLGTVVAVIVLSGLVGAAPAQAARHDPSSSTSAATSAPLGRAAAHAPGQRRGHVVLEQIEPRVEPGTEAEPAPPFPSVEGSAGTSVEGSAGTLALPAIDLGTSNGGVAPTLSKHGTTVGTNQHPEPTIAVGPDHVIRSNHPSFTITNRDGAAPLTVSYLDLFQLPKGTWHFRGQMYYDAEHKRWFAIQQSSDFHLVGGVTCGHGYFDFAISDTANPRLGWSIYWYSYDDAYVDRPRFGSSADKFVLTARISPMACPSGEGQGYWGMIAISWSDILDQSEWAHSYWSFSDGAIHPVRSLVPAVANGFDGNDIHVIAMAYESAPELHTWDLRVSGDIPGAFLTSVDVVEAEVVPPFDYDYPVMPQPIGEIYPSVGPLTAVTHGNRLLTASTERCTPAGDSVERGCVRILDLDLGSATPSRRQDFFIAKEGYDLWDPSIAFSQVGELVISYHRSTAVEGPSVYVVTQRPTDALNTVSAARLLQASTGPHGAALPGAELLTAAPDPLVSDGVWVISQTGFDQIDWRLNVAQARTATGNTYNPIAPVRILDTRNGTGLSGGFVASVPRTFNVAGDNGIPANAVAITGNVTVPGQAVDLGYLSMAPSLTTPSIKSPPATSTLNFPRNDTRANNITLPLNQDGDLMAVVVAAGQTHVILDATGYFTADDSGATYQPITAVRKLDTRTGTGLTGKFNANTPRSFQVTGGTIPAEATAVTGNLTVVGQGKAGYVSLTPNQQINPTTSTINFPLGDTRANGVTVPLSGTGKLWAVFKASGGSTDLIFDVTGYYLEGTSGLRFYPLNPGRIMDTRPGISLTQLAGQFTSSVPRTLVTGGHFGVPGNALAVTGNLTVVGQTRAGYVSITKDPTATPAVSTLNFPLGDVRANGATVPLNAANDLAIVYKGTTGAKTHLILDVTGYFR